MASGFPADMIRCQACGAREVKSGGVQRDALVLCCGCGTVLSTWCEFLGRIGASIEAGSVDVERGSGSTRRRLRWPAFNRSPVAS
jgi:hypothetical protein